MFGEIGVPFSYAGIISMIISAGTIISSLLSDKLTRKPGSGAVDAALNNYYVALHYIRLYLAALAVLMLAMSERVNRVVKENR